MSVDNERSFKVRDRQEGYATFSHRNFGPVFGDGDLVINFDLPYHVTELGSVYEAPYDLYYLSDKEMKGYLAGGNTKFLAEEIEVHLLSWSDDYSFQYGGNYGELLY